MLANQTHPKLFQPVGAFFNKHIELDNEPILIIGFESIDDVVEFTKNIFVKLIDTIFNLVTFDWLIDLLTRCEELLEFL